MQLSLQKPFSFKVASSHVISSTAKLNKNTKYFEFSFCICRTGISPLSILFNDVHRVSSLLREGIAQHKYKSYSWQQKFYIACDNILQVY